MSGTNLPPNALADLYDSLYSMLEALPSETHPAWELAIESVLFGGEGIAPKTIPYGEQQAEEVAEEIVSQFRERVDRGYAGWKTNKQTISEIEHILLDVLVVEYDLGH